MSQIADDANFDHVLNQDALPVLIDFWAPWCKPCQSLSPLLEEIAAENASKFRLVKVNADESQDLAKRFNVRSLPTLVIMSGGETLGRKIGAPSRHMLEQWLKESLSAA